MRQGYIAWSHEAHRLPVTCMAYGRDSPQSQEIAIVSDEIRGSYRDLIYIVTYQREGGSVSWSASLEDNEGTVIFITSYFICSLGKIHCEKLIRQRIFASIDEYHRRHETPTLH